jgi:hypothetical protein
MRGYENVVFEAPFEELQNFMNPVSIFIFLKLELVKLDLFR